jgi:hypothetical protein
MLPLRVLLLTTWLPHVAAAEIDFNRDVRPILTKNCTTCHGGVKMAGDVSYLYREDVLGQGDSGKTIVVPGDPEASEMIQRLLTSDPDDRMPPPDHHPEPLPQAEIEILTQWIRQGAEWGIHWAFEKPVEPPKPTLSDESWPSQTLDRFILARLEEEKLGPSPAAGPAEWLRRVSLDLTGLPPTLEEFAAFEASVKDDPQSAKAAVVDRLLASPAYGEHWATMWLDLARYSDTFGFEKDPHREIWPFRDWVISAFNEDMPFDEFTTKQLAGDLLDNPAPSDRIATAFHRNTQNNTEGGTDDEEWRMAAVIDRVKTTWTAWNAVTYGCVQCHAHPYEPIPHKAYYEFLAFFNNTEDLDLTTDFPRTKAAHDPARQAEAAELEREIRASRQALNDQAREVARRLEKWNPFEATTTRAEPDTGRIEQGIDGDFISSGTNPNHSSFVLTGNVGPVGAIRLSLLPLSDDPTEWDEQGAVVTRFTATLVGPGGGRREIALREVVTDYLAGPFEPNESLRDGDSGFGEYPMMKGPRTAWIVPVAVVEPKDGEHLEITIRHGAVCNGDFQNTVLRRFRIEITGTSELAAMLASESRADDWRALERLRAQYDEISGTMIPATVERSDAARRDTRIFIRGNRTTPGEKVEPGVPELFGGNGEINDRVDVARWLTGRENPLAARVLANRLWAALFGTGIVETLEDFGSSGALPSHPELLDHLALRLRDHHGWHLKPFLKELVLSAAYGQSHAATPDLIERDPRNRLIARGPRNRLTAEMIRDQALLVSGLLSRKQGGRPVYPPQPEGIWNTVYNGEKWDTSGGEDRYRRAIYTYHKRTAGYPGFLAFDAPARDLCSARRLPTNTPLQALVTLNDPAHMEFAQAFAKRMAGSDLRARLDHGYRLLTMEAAPPEVIDALAALHADAAAEYQKTPKEASKLASTPDEAALILVANTLLNSDLALNR